MQLSGESFFIPFVWFSLDGGRQRLHKGFGYLEFYKPIIRLYHRPALLGTLSRARVCIFLCCECVLCRVYRDREQRALRSIRRTCSDNELLSIIDCRVRVNINVHDSGRPVRHQQSDSSCAVGEVAHTEGVRERD